MTRPLLTLHVRRGSATVDVVRKNRERASNLRPVLRDQANELRKLARRSITTSTDVDGRPFAPLSPRTLRDKLRGGWDLRPLIRTRALYRGLYAEARGGKSIEAGVRGRAGRYAAFHLSGTRTMPARRFLPADGRTGRATAPRGPVARWLAGLRTRVGEYIATGRARGARSGRFLPRGG